MQDKEIYSYVNTKANLENLLKARQRGIDSDEGKNWCYRDGAGGFHVTANQNEDVKFKSVECEEGILIGPNTRLREVTGAEADRSDVEIWLEITLDGGLTWQRATRFWVG